MFTIKMFVHGDTIIAKRPPRPLRAIPADTINYVGCEFEYDIAWEDTFITAYFKNSKVETVYELSVIDGKCTIPWEVLIHPGIVYLNLKGVRYDALGEKVYQITSEPIGFLVNHDSMTEAFPALPPSQTAYESFVAGVHTYAQEAKDARDEAEEARDTAQGILDQFNTVSVELRILDPGDTGYADYSYGHFIFGIPKGVPGDKGDKGDPGDGADIESISNSELESMLV